MRAVVEFPPERVQEIAESAEFLTKVKAVVRELGANRDSELMTVALLTAEIAGIDVLETLRAAATQREASAADAGDEAIGELAEVVSDLAGAAPRLLADGPAATRLKQSVVFNELNHRRRLAGKFPIGSRQFASCRREIGVKDEWLRSVHKSSVWELPSEFIVALGSVASEPTPCRLGPLTPPGPPSRHGGEGERGDPGDPVGQPRGPPPLPGPTHSDDLFNGRPTRTDLLRGRGGVG
jgi:hypothetical protein